MAKKNKRSISPEDIISNEAAPTEEIANEAAPVEEVESTFDRGETEVIAPVEEAPVVVEEKTTVKPKAIKATNVEKMIALLDEYNTIATRQPIVTATIQKQLIAKFQNIMQFTLRVKENKVFEELFKFFMQKDKTLMAPSVALQGINSLPPTAAMRLECFYTVFSELIIFKKTRPLPGQKKKYPLDLNGIREVLACEEFVNFVSSKI